MSQTDRMLSLIDEALHGLRFEIEKYKAGVEALDSLKTLNFLQERLLAMRENMLCGSNAKDERFKGSMAHIVVDGWPPKNELRALISEIDYLYYR